MNPFWKNMTTAMVLGMALGGWGQYAPLAAGAPGPARETPPEERQRDEWARLMTQGKEAMAARQYRQAVALYEQAVKLWPSNPAAQRALADARQALAGSRPAPRPGPKLDMSPQARFARLMEKGKQAMAAGQFLKATRSYRKALRLQPGHAVAAQALRSARQRLVAGGGPPRPMVGKLGRISPQARQAVLLKNPTLFIGPDGSVIRVQLDAGGHILGASAVGKDGVTRRIQLAPWPSHGTTTYTEGNKAPLTLSMVVQGPTFTVRAQAGDQLLTVSFTPRGYKILATTVWYRAGRELNRNEGTLRGPEDIQGYLNYHFGQHFTDYVYVIRYFDPILSEAVADLSAPVSQAMAQAGSNPNARLQAFLSRHEWATLARGVVWGLAGLAVTGLGVAATPFTGGASLGTALFFVGSFLAGFDASVGNDLIIDWEFGGNPSPGGGGTGGGVPSVGGGNGGGYESPRPPEEKAGDDDDDDDDDE